jgi:hypothetical protein
MFKFGFKTMKNKNTKGENVYSQGKNKYKMNFPKLVTKNYMFYTYY